MTPLQIIEFKAHAKTRAYLNKLDRLIHLINDTDPRTSYVSFSAGKDSQVIAHAYWSAYKDINILMIDPGCPTHWTECERIEWLDYAKKNGWNLKLFEWDKWGLKLDTEDIKEYQSRIHNDMFNDLNRFASSNNLSTKIMGLRASESYARLCLIGKKGNRYEYKNGGEAILPIATWKTQDVWAYIVSTDMPVLDIYKKNGPNARNGLIGRSGENFGRIEYLKEHFPDIWRFAIANSLI